MSSVVVYEEQQEFNLVSKENIERFREEALGLYEKAAPLYKGLPFASFEWLSEVNEIDDFCEMMTEYVYDTIATMENLPKDHRTWTEDQQEEADMTFTCYHSFFEGLFFEDIEKAWNFHKLAFQTYGSYKEEFTRHNVSLGRVW